MDFCENFKGSVDIDSWSLQELQEVSLFQHADRPKIHSL